MSDTSILAIISFLALGIGILAVLLFLFTRFSSESATAALKTATESMAFVRSELATARVRIEQLSKRVGEAEEINYISIAYIRMLLGILVQNGIEHPTMPEQLTLYEEETGGYEIDRTPATISQHFNMEEMEMLATDLGIEPEDIAGQTRHQRAYALCDYADRHGMRSKLLRELRRLRPFVAWPKK